MRVQYTIAIAAAGLSIVGAGYARGAVDAAPPSRGMGAPVIDPIQSQIVTPSTEPPPIGLGPLPIPAGPREPRGNPLWSVPLKNLNATRERPIFLPSRRAPAPAVAGAPPPPVIAPPPAPAEPERPQLALVGAVSGENDGIAVFMNEATRDIVRLRTGENHDGWVLRSVRGREATLEKGPETAILALPDPLAPPGAPGVPGVPGRKTSEPEL
jgi:general secretion pathway protein N